MSSNAQDLSDAEIDLSWSEAAVLAPSQAAATPEAPGLLVLVRVDSSTTGRPYVAWAEAPDSVRFRVRELAGHATVGPELGAILFHEDLRFRYAIVEDATTRHKALQRLRGRMASMHDG